MRRAGPAASFHCCFGACRSSSLQRRFYLDSTVHGGAVKLHQLNQQVRAFGEGRLLEKRLLCCDIERRDLRDRIDQHLVVETADGVPVDGEAERVPEPARLPLDLGTLRKRQRRRLAVVELPDVDFGAAVCGVEAEVADEPEPVGAQQDNVEPAVVQLLDSDDLADAADGVERRLIIVVKPLRLDHSDLARAVDRVAHHVAIARFENVQRQLRAREQDRSGQRKDRQPEQSAHVNSTADKRRRWALDQGSSSPCASRSWRKRLRAAPSFHSRSRRTTSSKSSAPPSRFPAAIFAEANSNRASWSSGFAASRCSSAVVSTAGADASSSAARARATSGLSAISGADASRISLASAVSSAAMSARTRPPMTSGLSGAMSRT